MLGQSYSITLLILSVAVAALGIYTTVETARRVRFNEGRRRFRWAYAGALTLALAIWSADVTGSLAIYESARAWYDPLLLVAAFVAALVASGPSLAQASDLSWSGPAECARSEQLVFQVDQPG